MDTKSLIVKEATRLFYEKGYVSVGLAEIIATTGTSKGSFYHHFPKGKEQLLIHCLEQVQLDVITDMEKHFEEGKSFDESVISIFTELIHMYERNGRIDGYTFTSMVSEVSIVSEEVREICAQLYTKIVSFLTKQLIKHNVSEEIAYQKAIMLTSLIEGSIVLTIMKRSIEPLEVVLLQIGQYLNIKGAI